MKQTILPLLVCIALLLSCLFAAELVTPAVANPDQATNPLLSMPIEYVNYTIVRVNGTLWAKIDGTYPIHLSADSSCVSLQSLLMVYPTPPGTVNIHVALNETELVWGNYTQTYPAALHHTAVGDWPMINCAIAPLSDFFTLKIHYEHPLATVNDSFLFLYDLNISPYLSPESPSSTAYFNIRFEENIQHLEAYTTETDTDWNPINYMLGVENEAQMVAIQIQSEYSKPLLGDLAITFSTNGNENEDEALWFQSRVILTFLVVAAVLACVDLLVYFRKRGRVQIV